MSSPTLGGLKSKKKYSGALFLENDEFDCFAEEARDESSEDGKIQKKEIMKSLSRKESNHLGLSNQSRKFSKKIEEDENEDQDESHKLPAHKNTHKSTPQKSGLSEQSKFTSYSMPNAPNYTDMSKGFLPTSATKIGMNSIPAMPFMNQAINQPRSLTSFSQPRGFSSDVSPMYHNMEQEDEDYDSNAAFFGLTDHQIMQNFEEFISNQQDCRLLQSRAELRPSFLDMIFKHISTSFADYCVDPSTTVFATSIIDLAVHDPAKMKQLIGSFKGRMIQLCSDTYGTRVLQRLIEKTYNKPEVFELLVAELRGNICMLVMCNNGNHVVQKLISQAKCPQIPWVYDEILDKFKALGMHKHGCCVIQRCIDHANSFYKVGASNPGQNRRCCLATRSPVCQRHVRQLRCAVRDRETLQYREEEQHHREVRRALRRLHLPEVRLQRHGDVHQVQDEQVRRGSVHLLLQQRQTPQLRLQSVRQLRRANLAEQLPGRADH